MFVKSVGALACAGALPCTSQNQGGLEGGAPRNVATSFHNMPSVRQKDWFETANGSSYAGAKQATVIETIKANQKHIRDAARSAGMTPC